MASTLLCDVSRPLRSVRLCMFDNLTLSERSASAPLAHNSAGYRKLRKRMVSKDTEEKAETVRGYLGDHRWQK
jgi:hypothetical protein